jgi:hypothetical protein
MGCYLSIESVKGLKANDKEKLNRLMEVYNHHYAANAVKDHYYDGKVSLAEVNLGIALPNGMSKLEIACSWGSKTVDVLAGLSMFDGFVNSAGANADIVDRMVYDNRLISEYAKACRDELKYGCTFATLSADPIAGCRIRFHSPQTSAALWSGEKGRIDCGFAIIDTAQSDEDEKYWLPAIVNMYTDTHIIVLHRNSSVWTAEYFPHSMGRPLMEPLIWNATSSKPFGQSRIKEPIRRLIQGYVRTIANATIGLEFSTAPQKYLLGITDEQYDMVINQKFKQYIGSILAATTNPETGEKPTFGQFQQGSISSHVEMIRVLATQFSAATGLPVTETGVVNDANPTSSDAIIAQSRTLTQMAEQLNASNAQSLRIIMLMGQAIAQNTTLSGLSEEQRNIIAHFKNPALPSVAASADAAIKIASGRPAFAATDVFLEMVGFDQADIRRIKAQEKRSAGLDILADLGAEL